MTENGVLSISIIILLLTYTYSVCHIHMLWKGPEFHWASLIYSCHSMSVKHVSSWMDYYLFIMKMYAKYILS